MPDAFVGRQPIFNRRLDVVGYELLFRASYLQGAASATAEHATATVVLNALTELELPRVVGNRMAWINISRDFVLTDLVQAVPYQQIGLEISAAAEFDPELVQALRDLKLRGFRLALDDFAWQPQAEATLDFFDVVKLSLDELAPEPLGEQVARLQQRGVHVLAEKVETHDEYELCESVGFDLFQGYFFCRPAVLATRSVAPNRLALLQVVAAVHEPAVQLEDLERLIARDVALSFRLLRYVNSAYFGLRGEVRSVSQALALLGVENVRRWVTLSALATIDDKPTELMVTALIRARFCELAGQPLGVARGPELFTLGLFSVLDGMMDAPMGELVAQLPLAEDVREALVLRSGERGRLLDCVSALEAGAPGTLGEDVVERPGAVYFDSVIWANAAAESLFGELGAAAKPLPVELARSQRGTAREAASASSTPPPGLVVALPAPAAPAPLALAAGPAPVSAGPPAPAAEAVDGAAPASAAGADEVAPSRPGFFARIRAFFSRG